MNFSEALNRVKDGKKIQRRGWNGKGLYVVHQKGYPEGIPINKNTANALGLEQGTVCKFRPYLTIKSVDGAFVPWLPSQSDLLEDDWVDI